MRVVGTWTVEAQCVHLAPLVSGVMATSELKPATADADEPHEGAFAPSLAYTSPAASIDSSANGLWALAAVAT